MADIKNSHIQGNLTISASSQPSNGQGIVFTDFLQETTTNSGIKIIDSLVNIETNGNAILKLTNDISESSYIRLNSSTESGFNGPKALTINNDSGNIYVKSKGGLGLSINETTGNITVESTTDSINFSNSALVVNGGISVNKSLLVNEQIQANSGYHSLTNDQISERVLKIQNTSVSGYSTVDFFDSNDVNQLQIGYGNSSTNAPFQDQSYIGTTSGSLLLRANGNSSILVNNTGDVDILKSTTSNSSNTGALKVAGGIGISNATDATSVINGGSITTAGGVAIAKSAFIGSYLNLVENTAPSAPSASTVKTFYIDNADTLLKSKNNADVITTYQPSNTKGDIVVHNGTTQVRIPVGQDGYSLVADSTSTEGVKWSQIVSGTGSSNAYYLTNISNTYVVDNASGSYFNAIFPTIQTGSSCILVSSKSSVGINGVNARFVNNPSTVNSGNINISWTPYTGIGLIKSYTEGLGNYIVNGNKTFTKTTFSLSGTTYTNFSFNFTTGCFFFSISNYISGPSATFMVTKNVASQATGNSVRLVSAPGTSNCQLEVRWQSNSNLQIRKNNSNNDGSYFVTDNFQLKTEFNLTLSGTSYTNFPVDVFNFYQNKSVVVRITSAVSGSPCALIMFSKNNFSNNGVSYLVRSPGLTTSELLELRWQSSSLVSIRKNGSGYDGSYKIELTFFN